MKVQKRLKKIKTKKDSSKGNQTEKKSQTASGLFEGNTQLAQILKII